MQIFRLLGIGIAAALLTLASPAMAAVSGPTEITFENGFKVTATTLNDCLASFDLSHSILFVEAESGCDVTLAEATGLCLAPAANAPLQRPVAVFDPERGVSCTTLHPSPPG